jgi:hypothetical protein
VAVDWACGEREPVTNDFAVDDVRGLFADSQPTRYMLSFGLELQDELVSRHGSPLPSAIPHKPGIRAGGQHHGEARCALRERPIDRRRDQVPGRAHDRYRCDCQSTFHLHTSLFRPFRRNG